MSDPTPLTAEELAALRERPESIAEHIMRDMKVVLSQDELSVFEKNLHLRKLIIDKVVRLLATLAQATTAREAAERERDEWKILAAVDEKLPWYVERLEQSMIDHFERDHLAGDGPEIDRWKARVAALEEAILRAAHLAPPCAYGPTCDAPQSWPHLKDWQRLIALVTSQNNSHRNQ